VRQRSAGAGVKPCRTWRWKRRGSGALTPAPLSLIRDFLDPCRFLIHRPLCLNCNSGPVGFSLVLAARGIIKEVPSRPLSARRSKSILGVHFNWLDLPGNSICCELMHQNAVTFLQQMRICGFFCKIMLQKDYRGTSMQPAEPISHQLLI